MLVDGVPQLHFDLFQAVEHDRPLLFRQVQCFVGFVREEGVFPDFPSERCAADEIGMKQQSDGLRGNTFDIGIADGLSRSDADHGLVVEIIPRLPVVDSAAPRLLEENRIESHRHPVVSLTFGRVEPDHAHQRVAGLESEEFVVAVDRIDLQNFVHTARFFHTQR